MNIFAVAWNIPELNAQRIQAELSRMAEVYPTLDTRTVWMRHSEGPCSMGCISTPHRTSAPRVYAARDATGVAIYSGLPIDPDGEVAAHDARKLLTNWERICGRLEGTYAIVRLLERPAVLEIQTDIVGGEPVYYTIYRGGYLISNSVLLLERLSSYRSLDELGVSMFLRLGHVLGDRTLRHGIRVIPGGQRWEWRVANKHPRKSDYYPLSTLANRKRQQLSRPFTQQLAHDLQKPLLSLEKHFDTFVCPLTGGKDSRLVASLLIAAGIDARYFTFGSPNGDDAIIAEKIANRFGLQYSFLEIDESHVSGNWDECVPRSIRATDGMRSLYLLAGLAKSKPIHANTKDLYLWGACGELARAYFGDTMFGRPVLTLDDVKELLPIGGPTDPSGMVNPEAVSRALAWRGRALDNIADCGFDLADVADVYGNHVVDARRLGNNGRGLAELRDTLSPFATRAFFEAAISLDPKQRLTEPLHFSLTQLLTPELHAIPFAQDRWRTQNVSLNILERHFKRQIEKAGRKISGLKSRIGKRAPQYSYQDSMFNRLAWLEERRGHLRELALDAPASAIWDYVNRNRFEEIMSPETHRSVRSRSLRLLLHIVTLVYYENGTDRCDNRVLSNQLMNVI